MTAGVRAAIAFAALAVAPIGAAEPAEPRNVILLSLDTLRADRLGCYGAERPTSPTLDAFARRGVCFERVVTESSWTLPAHMSLFTGLHPTSHGVTLESQRLPGGVRTMAEVLQAGGWATAAFTEGGLVGGDFGFSRGFDVYEERSKDVRLTMYRGRRWLEERDPERPFFLFLHTYAVHCPYHPPEEYATRFRTRPADDSLATEGKCGNPHFNRMTLTPGQVGFLRDQYDAGIRAADDQVRDLLRILDEQDLRDDTILVLLSDHGEELHEHGQIGHERTLYIESLLVPLVIVAPGIGPRVVRAPVGLTDVMPTVLDLVGLDVPPVQGQSLVAAMLGEPGAHAPRFSELDRDVRLRSVVRGDHHLIVDLDRGARNVFDLRSDPGEQARLGAESSPGAELETILDDHVQGLPVPADVPGRELTPEQRERLKALGYVR
jgi:arylsulfatase A-like enzyme